MDKLYRAQLKGVKALLDERGVSLRDAAEATATSYQYLLNVLHGRSVSRPVLERILHYLDHAEEYGDA